MKTENLSIEHLNCLECGWEGDITDCPTEKQHDHDYATNSVTYFAVPLCPTCGSEHLADYDSQEAKDTRMLYLGHE